MPAESRRLPRAFQLLWGATAISNVGDGLRLTALPLLATSVTTDPRAIAGVAIAERIPWLVFILPGGAWADRFDRRVLRLRLDIARAVVMAGLAAMIALDHVSIAVIYAVAALLASAEAVVDSSSMALVPAIVDRRDLERAGSRLTSTELVTNGLIGPPLGGLLFGLAVVVPFAVDAASFAAAAATIAWLPGTYQPVTNAGHAEPMWREIGEGFRWLWRRPSLRKLALISTALGLSGFVGASVFVLFATVTLGLTGAEYGLLLVPAALGGLFGSWLSARLASAPLRVVLATSITVSGAATLTTAATSWPVLVAVLGGIESAAVVVWNVLTVALRQRLIPDHLLGRVGASYRFLVYIGMPFGALLGGLLADAFSIRIALALAGSALLVISALIPLLLRRIDDTTRTHSSR